MEEDQAAKLGVKKLTKKPVGTVRNQKTDCTAPHGGHNNMNKFGVIPKLSLWQKLILAINGQVFIAKMKGTGDYGISMVYVVRCIKHGNYLDSPHGYSGYFSCDECLKEQKKKCHVLPT